MLAICAHLPIDCCTLPEAIARLGGWFP